MELNNYLLEHCIRNLPNIDYMNTQTNNSHYRVVLPWLLIPTTVVSFVEFLAAKKALASELPASRELEYVHTT